jgi:cell division protein FtsL
MKEQLIQRISYTQLELRCFVKGRPKPVITWYRNKKIFKVNENTGIKLEDNNQRLIFTRLLDTDSGLYECEASNIGGKLKRSARLKVDRILDDTNNGLSNEEVVVIVLFVVVGTVMIFMAVYVGKKIRQERVSSISDIYYLLKFFSTFSQITYNHFWLNLIS